MIDGKARLVSDLVCDGLGACLGHCPEDAITIEEREAEPYDEVKVMENIVRQGENTIRAHLVHLKEHNEINYYEQAVNYLEEKNMENPLVKEKAQEQLSGCPGSRAITFEKSEPTDMVHENISLKSELRHWPVQMHLISPHAEHYKNSDLLLAADCVGYSLGDFHNKYLKGKSLAIACPKLDEHQNVYLEKITTLIDSAEINTISVMIMQVPCCGGLLNLVQQAAANAQRKVPIKSLIVSLKGEILKEEWI